MQKVTSFQCFKPGANKFGALLICKARYKIAAYSRCKIIVTEYISDCNILQFVESGMIHVLPHRSTCNGRVRIVVANMIFGMVFSAIYNYLGMKISRSLAQHFAKHLIKKFESCACSARTRRASRELIIP